MTRDRLITVSWLLVIIIGALTLILNPAEAESAGIECATWAYAEGEDNYPDSAVMHTIGCDNDGTVGGTYYRVEGRCAYVARDAYRSRGFEAASDELDAYMLTRGCDTLEDGSYEDEGTNQDR